MNPEKTVSAQVVLPAASGARPGGQTRITSANIQEWMPSPENVHRVTEALREKGFSVGQTVGNSFSITGPARLFEATLQTKLRELGDGSVKFQDGGLELSAKKIPAALRDHVAAITFTPPPDFGPPRAGSFD